MRHESFPRLRWLLLCSSSHDLSTLCRASPLGPAQTPSLFSGGCRQYRGGGWPLVPGTDPNARPLTHNEY